MCSIFTLSEEDLSNEFLSVDKLVKGHLPKQITDDQFKAICYFNYKCFEPEGENYNEWILGNLLGKLILLRREGKTSYTEGFMNFCSHFYKVKSQNLARICLRGGDKELYRLLQPLKIFCDVGVLPILACSTNDLELVSELCKSCKGYGPRADEIYDVLSCKECDPEVFVMVEGFLGCYEIRHLFLFSQNARLTQYLWENFKIGNKREFLEEDNVRQKIYDDKIYPDILEYLLTQITKRDYWRPLNTCDRLIKLGHNDLAQRLHDAFNRNPPF